MLFYCKLSILKKENKFACFFLILKKIKSPQIIKFFSLLQLGKGS